MSEENLIISILDNEHFLISFILSLLGIVKHISDSKDKGDPVSSVIEPQNPKSVHCFDDLQQEKKLDEFTNEKEKQP